MKRFAIIIVTTIILMVIYRIFLYKPQEVSIASTPVSKHVNKHTDAFNASMNRVVTSYLSLKDAFIEADTLSVKKYCALFIQALNGVDTNLLRRDTTCIYDVVLASMVDMNKNAQSMLLRKDITEMKKDFSSLSDALYPAFFQGVKYEGRTIYLQNCPMAFNDEIPANWISDSSEIDNPYMGKKHPVYKATMLHCGELLDSFIS